MRCNEYILIVLQINFVKAGDPATAATKDKNYLFDALITQLQQQPLQWRLIITVGQASDSIKNATIAWPENRERIDVGILTFTH